MELFQPKQIDTRGKVYDRIRLLAAKHFSDCNAISNGGSSILLLDKFIAELVLELPTKAFELDEPLDTTVILGELLNDRASDGENESSSQISMILQDMWTWHYYNPVDKPLKILLSSTGGEVDAAGAIISAINDMRRVGRQVHIHVAGYAWSAAFDIVQFADVRTAEPTASFMTHTEKWASTEQDDAFKKIREGISSKKLMAVVFEHIATRTGRSLDYYMKKVKNGDWFMTAQEAMDEGLLDAVLDTPSFKKTPYKPTPRATKATAKVAKVNEQLQEAA